MFKPGMYHEWMFWLYAGHNYTLMALSPSLAKIAVPGHNLQDAGAAQSFYGCPMSPRQSVNEKVLRWNMVCLNS